MQDKVGELIHNIDLLLIYKRSSFKSLFALSDVNEEEWNLSSQKLFTWSWLVTTQDLVVIKQLVGHFEQAIMHTILSIEEQIVKS